MNKINTDKRRWNKKWFLCLFFIHDWEMSTMSLEAYAQRFWYCKRCGLMNYKECDQG